MWQRCLWLLILMAGYAHAAPARADGYPSKPIRAIVQGAPEVPWMSFLASSSISSPRTPGAIEDVS